MVQYLIIATSILHGRLALPSTVHSLDWHLALAVDAVVIESGAVNRT
jgi:hypothetical protein